MYDAMNCQMCWRHFVGHPVCCTKIDREDWADVSLVAAEICWTVPAVENQMQTEPDMDLHRLENFVDLTDYLDNFAVLVDKWAAVLTNVQM